MRKTTLALATLAMLTGTAHSTCYTLYAADGRMISSSPTPPYSLAWPAEDTAAKTSRARGNHLIISQGGCHAVPVEQPKPKPKPAVVAEARSPALPVSNPARAPIASTPPPAPRPVLSGCRADLKCWAEQHLASATAKCASQIERMSKFSFEWMDKGWFESKMSRYGWKDRDQGIVTYIGDKIRLQNGFGAWAPYSYACDFDTTSDSVVDIRLAQGRLPE